MIVADHKGFSIVWRLGQSIYREDFQKRLQKEGNDAMYDMAKAFSGADIRHLFYYCTFVHLGYHPYVHIPNIP